MFLRSARYTDIIICEKTVLKDFILPIRIGIPGGEVERRISFIGELFIIKFLELGGIHHLDSIRYMFPAERSVDVYQCLPLLCLLGGNDNHTIGTSHAEDCQ